MKVHALICGVPPRKEKIEGSSSTQPGLAVSVSELVRRQSMGLPLGVGVHGVTDIPEGISYEQARFEALRYVRMEQDRKAAAAAAASTTDGPPASEA